MGKSDKKVKSERINALRKQYDAFLEEDKKRKERNEYILGRLDKMRYSTALVPVRHKPSPVLSRPVVYPLGYQTEIPAVRDFQPTIISKTQLIPDNGIQKTDDNYLIQEISKNYILIPKLRPSLMHNFVQQTNTGLKSDPVQDRVQETNNLKASSVHHDNENADWKSKYEILNILKKDEKENVKFAEENTPETDIDKEHSLSNILKPDAASIDHIINTNTDKQCKYYDELPEKDISVEKHNDVISEKDSNNTTYADLDSSINKVNDNQVLAAAPDEITDIDYKLQNTDLGYDYSYSADTNMSGDMANYEEHDQYNLTEATNQQQPEQLQNYAEHEYEIIGPSVDNSNNQVAEDVNENVYSENEGGIMTYAPEVQAAQFQSECQENVSYVDRQDENPMPAIDPNNLNQTTNNEHQNLDYETPANIEYPNENISVENVTNNNADFQIKMRADDSVDTTQVEQPSDDQAPIQQVPGAYDENNTTFVTDAINEFETEQGEMFSSDPVDNYGYQEQEINKTHPPHSDQVYPEAENSPQLNQEYSYYEGAPSEAYPSQIDENQEQTEAYDPNYHEQYVASYEKSYQPNQPAGYEEQSTYEQPQAYEQQQNYEQQQLYEQQQNYEQQQPYEQIHPEDVVNLYDQVNVVDENQIVSVLNTEDGFAEQNIDETNSEQIVQNTSEPITT